MQVIVLKEAKILESKCDMCNLKILNQSIQILKAVMLMYRLMMEFIRQCLYVICDLIYSER